MTVFKRIFLRREEIKVKRKINTRRRGGPCLVKLSRYTPRRSLGGEEV
jgi:hypothetical protein